MYVYGSVATGACGRRACLMSICSTIGASSTGAEEIATNEMSGSVTRLSVEVEVAVTQCDD